MPLNEADTCTRLIVPKLRASGWDDDPHSFTEQYQITDGRIVVIGQTYRRKQPKRADWVTRQRSSIASYDSLRGILIDGRCGF